MVSGPGTRPETFERNGFIVEWNIIISEQTELSKS